MTLKQSDKILAINDKLAEYVIKLGAPRKQTIVLKAGIDINQYDPNISGTNIRNKYGFTNDDIILFFMGWLYNFSGLKEVAMKLAKPENRLFKVLIVGDGDAYNELNEIRDKYNLQERLILIGKKRYQEIPEYIAAADICILPAYPWEPIMQDIVPIKLYEYMAMRKPVICTKLPGVMTEFGNDNGIIYVDKPEDVIDKASELNSNDKLIEVGTKALKFSRENSWEKITDKFEIILQEVIREKRNEL
jgi:glycosyltransferase involved in cell wall biosynthesis